MSFIPGLSFVPPDAEEGELIKIQSFTGSFSVPESHRYGNCRPRTSLQKVGTIYEGNFATVYKCKDEKDGQIYALKKFEFTDEMLKDGIRVSFLREINILKLLKHHNIVNSHEVIAGKRLERHFLLLDYCVTSLHELIEKKCNAIYERDVVKYMMRQLFEGISYLHESSVIHRNLSCRNLLFTECGTLKISGFRTARFLDKGYMPPEVTELAFRAPELLFQAHYGLPIDLWSAGCVFAHLLLKRPLFTGDSESNVLSSIFQVIGTPSEAIWPGFNEILNSGIRPKKFSVELPYSDLKNILSGVPDYSSQLLADILLYYPPMRIDAAEALKSPYFLDTPPECSQEKVMSILKDCLTVSNLLDIPMNAVI